MSGSVRILCIEWTTTWAKRRFRTFWCSVLPTGCLSLFGTGSMLITSRSQWRRLLVWRGVALDSSTETFVAMKVFIDTWRWAGVPFYLRTGKRLSRRATEIALQFKHPPLPLFQGPAASVVKPNVLAMNIQPHEGITLSFGSKVPGPQLQVNPVRMDFRYGTSSGIPTTEAYERLLLESLLGDSTLFARSDGVEEAWSFVDGIVSRWSEEDVGEPAFYEAGGWGPEEAEEMMDRDGRAWRRL